LCQSTNGHSVSGMPVHRKEIQEHIEEVGRADILIGIPSYNNAATIIDVVKTAYTGLSKYFPESSSILVNSDGGSVDGTPKRVAECEPDQKKIVLSHRVEVNEKLVTPYNGIPGKGNAFRLILEMGARLGVKACVVLNPDVRNPSEEWLKLLLQPILREGYDYVLPYYQRHKYDGTITNSIVYPLIRAMYGKRIRHPLGGQVSFTGDLAKYFLTKEVWNTEVVHYGMDLWMTSTAIANGSKICQAALGGTLRDSKSPSIDLSAMLVQVLGSVFVTMDEYDEFWKGVTGSDAIPIIGSLHRVDLEPIHVNVDRMLSAFFLGLDAFLPIWEKILSKESLVELRLLQGKSKSDFHLPDELWTKLIYDYTLASHRKIMTWDHLLKSLTPVYLGRLASFILETRDVSDHAAEERIEQLCEVFEQRKPYLVKQWDEADEG
jgi:glucosylglycerate synthase